MLIGHKTSDPKFIKFNFDLFSLRNSGLLLLLYWQKALGHGKHIYKLD